MTTRDNVWPELFEMYFFEHTFTQDTTSFFPGEVSFVLRSPEDEAQFMAETRAGLAAMGEGGLCLGCKPCRYPLCPFGK